MPTSSAALASRFVGLISSRLCTGSPWTIMARHHCRSRCPIGSSQISPGRTIEASRVPSEILRIVVSLFLGFGSNFHLIPSVSRIAGIDESVKNGKRSTPNQVWKHGFKKLLQSQFREVTSGPGRLRDAGQSRPHLQ